MKTDQDLERTTDTSCFSENAAKRIQRNSLPRTRPENITKLVLLSKESTYLTERKNHLNVMIAK